MNLYKPHMVIIPEDDANRQIANGFLLQPALDRRRVQVLDLAGGWHPVLQQLIKHQKSMKRFPQRRVIGLVDFDNNDKRRQEFNSAMDPSLRARIFIIGSRGNPEELKKALGRGFEWIGKALAHDCMNGTSETWGHPLLNHNSEELARMQTDITPILFGRTA